MTVPEQIAKAYLRMAREVRYRPAAPSDGMGNITVPIDQLDLNAEVVKYVHSWLPDGKDIHEHHTGIPNYEDQAAFVYLIEAARILCGGDRRPALGLVKLALEDLEARSPETADTGENRNLT
ncbi:hypothetical protein ABDK96_03860 [Citricoccus nitrophenolicus]|uniref:dATP/dGTP diphosphohydrolase N-terminal domain-containing protein n=1 Tax=Citricoccus nitrophenolicus TaxID=863575 RepID=A0ABV0IF65_9MICC